MAKKETSKRFKNFASCLAKKLGKRGKAYEQLAAVQAKAVVKPRIFEGESASGAALGTYAASTKKTRARKGRQIARVDLQFTDQLFRSIQIANFKGRPSLMILPSSRTGGQTNREVAAKLEKRYGEIFAASDKEAKDIIKVIEKRLFKEADKFIDECFADNAVIA